MKKIFLIIIFSSILCYIIYNTTLNDKVNIFIIGDSLSINNNINYKDMIQENLTNKKLNNINNLIESNLTIEQTINKIDNNIEINNKSIQEIIEQADYIIIFLGNDELSYYHSSNQINKNIIDKYSYLLQKIRKINNNKIIILGILNETNKTRLINKEIYKLSVKTGSTYIDSSSFQTSLKNNQNYIFQKEISTKLLQEIKL